MTYGLRIGVSVALVAALLWATDPAEAVARLRGAEMSWLLLAVGLLTLQTVLMAIRWRLTAAQLGLRIGLRRAVGEYYLGQVVNTTLPGGVVGDAARAMRTRDGAGMIRAAQAVVIERLAGQMALFTVAILGFVAALWAPGGLAWPGWTGPAVVAAVAVSGIGTVALRRLAGGFTGTIWTALCAPDVRWRQIVLGLGIVAMNLMAFAACARATGTALTTEAAVTVIPLILTAMLIPLSVAGWGWREGAAATLFPLVGADPSAGVAAGVAFGLVLLTASLPGLLWPILAKTPARALTQGHGAASAIQWFDDRDPKEDPCRKPPSP
ncbi:MAG: lysylphosphatidylglycerol synthase transmembrane domain-containing protein [Pseudomonadota bacterium]